MACAADDGGWPDDEDQCSQEDAELGFWHDSLLEPRGGAAQPSEPPPRASSAKKFDTVFTNAKAGMAGVDAVRADRADRANGADVCLGLTSTLAARRSA